MIRLIRQLTIATIVAAGIGLPALAQDAGDPQKGILALS